jgi:hypothetical protein
MSVIIKDKMSMGCEVIHKDVKPPIKDKPHTVKEVRLIMKQRHVVLSSYLLDEAQEGL